MSNLEPNPSPIPGETNDNITHQAALDANTGGATNAELRAATDAANAKAAPASANDQAMSGMAEDIDKIKQALGMGEELTSLVGPAIGLVAPAGMSIMSRVSEAESILSDLIGAFEKHFGGKVALPAPPTTQGQPVFKPASTG